MKCIPVSAGNSPVRTASTTSFKKLPVPTASTAGPLSATAKKTTRPPRATYRATWSVMTTSTTTAPGAIFGAPIYGPAFVGFFGGGFGFGVGWFPLGFGEPFFPWFHCRHEFIERINIHNTFIRNRSVLNGSARNFNFVHARNVNAVTVANRNAFMNGQAINRGATHLTAASLRGARVTNSVGIKPTQHSSLGSVNVRSHAATPPAAVQNRTVVARTAPAQGASQMHVRTLNSTGQASGRVGNEPVNRTMNQHGVAPNTASRNVP